MKLCIVCSYPFEGEGDRKTCSDRCMNELENRRLIALEKRRHEKRLLAENPPLTMGEIARIVLENMSSVLLERNIPYFIANNDLDDQMCAKSTEYGKMSRAYRKRCINQNIRQIGYITHAKSTHGRTVFRLVDDKDVLRIKLQTLSGC